jgi:Leucine-rich repeat (LRR) protein
MQLTGSICTHAPLQVARNGACRRSAPQHTHTHSVNYNLSSIISIEAVRGCMQLRKLSLDGSTASDLGPLAGCAHLEELSMHFGSCISDLAPLGGCVKLTKLWIVGSQISDLAPLRGCVNLKTLWVSSSQVSDLAPLRGCVNLKMLRISSSQASDLAPLRGCVELQDLDISYCSRLLSIEGLEACTQLKQLDMNGLAEHLPGLAALRATLPQLRITGHEPAVGM